MVLTVYGIDKSPPYRAVLMTAKLLNIKINEELVDFSKGEEMKPEFVKLNPQHTIPTLTDDGFVVWDSHAIITYLVGKYGKDDSLYPKDLQKRATVDQRLHFNSGLLFPRLRGIFAGVIFRGMREIPEDTIKDVLDAYAFLESFLGRSTWLAGENITVADISMVADLSTIDVAVPVKSEKFPKLSAWYNRCKELPVYKEKNVPGLKAMADLFQKKLAENTN